jgi:hypothetical protein
MSKRKPNYNPTSTMQELLTAVCDYYGDPVDDRKEEDPDHVSLHDVADRFNITVMKARKLLITGGLYSTAISRRVQELHTQGLTVAQITEETGLKRASINSYLPYEHIIYNLPDISIKAERQKQNRVRKRNSVRTDAEREQKLWQELTYLQGASSPPARAWTSHIRFTAERCSWIGRKEHHESNRDEGVWESRRTGGGG